MKKIVLYVLVLVMLTFTIPVFFTSVTVESKAVENRREESEILIQKFGKKIGQIGDNKQKIEDIAPYDYKKYNTIKLLHSKTNSIEEIPLDEYLCGVVSAEMPVDFDIEALKAQAIVARTYTIYKILQNESKHGEAYICDDSSCCQAWISKEDRLQKWDEDRREENWNKIILAVTETKGKIITYDGKPINAFFHSNSGGATETPINVWGGGSEYPYLQTVETAGEESYEQYNSEVELSRDSFIQKMKEKYEDFEINFDEDDCIKVIEYTSGGRVRTIKIGNHNLSGVEVRTIFSLKSANFRIELGEKIKFNVIGYGHGVGMSQTGADSLAKQGANCSDIIKHFYVGVEIQDF